MNEILAYRLIKIFTNEGARHHGRPLYEAIIELMASPKYHCRCVVSRGIAGCNEKGEFSDRNILMLSSNMPLIIHIIVPFQEIETIQQELTTMIDDSIMTIEDINVINPAL
jgi:PII-like signaling protein